MLSVPISDIPGVSHLTADAFDGLFERTVPRAYVHRAGISEVLLTGSRAFGGDHFSLAAQWPRNHSFYRSSLGRQDPLLLAETIRQVGLFVGHQGYQVPLGHAFLMKTMHYEVDAAGLLLGHKPSDLLIHVDCRDTRRRGSDLTGLGFEARIERDGVTIGSGGGTYRCVSPSAYAKLRSVSRVLPPPGDGPAGSAEVSEPVAPELVGRSSPDDVVISAVGRERMWKLQMDCRNPALFDHPVDHVPGMVVLEAARQALLHMTGCDSLVPVGMRASFRNYLELDGPSFIKAEPGPPDLSGRTSVRFLVEQYGVVQAEVDFLAEPAGA
ncbi:ScbA/BarX family gamma-butyrolactone biosynthesis protein [Streptomyces coacervatus]|uniref:ScbA/BarX family gamma-butyrolactone biosynthesis protein n=1 Tax=Streptomyces coacervatus TaxID=647381 RepID=A0ABP7IRR0_9ACTN|nr:ScbA/BarX family gamma-butyrolactone biosynthesis protein [Streptomyces coacervatus]MDF2266808.1 ScbA/BarX family gamma-butyrolactone biosynthesis protein [Streptomyces coacervatus]